MSQHERGSPLPSSQGPLTQPCPLSPSSSASANTRQRPGLAAPLHQPSCGCDLARYTAIQAAFSKDLAQWQSHWNAITPESMAALAAHGIAISYRQSLCGSYVATLLHQGGGGIDSGLCPTLAEARSYVLGQGLEELP